MLLRSLTRGIAGDVDFHHSQMSYPARLASRACLASLAIACMSRFLEIALCAKEYVLGIGPNQFVVMVSAALNRH